MKAPKNKTSGTGTHTAHTWKKEEPETFVTPEELYEEIKMYEAKYKMSSAQMMELIKASNEPDGEHGEIDDWRLLIEWVG